jgi:cytochrome c5
MRPRLLALLLFVSGACACASGSIPHPSPADVTRAQEEWPDASAAGLERGRDLYVVRCSGCHPLHRPGEYERAGWNRVLAKMAPRARLSEEERTQILRYLAVVRGE